MEKKTEQPVQAGEQHHGTVGKKDAGYAPEKCGRFKKLLIPDDALIIDTETTGIGIDDEVVELAVLDLSGRCLYESLFHSSKAISPEASKINGLLDSDLQGAPNYREEYETIRTLCQGHPVLGYCPDFDIRLLRQTHNIHAADLSDFWKDLELIDAKALAMGYLDIQKFSLEAVCRCLGKAGKEAHWARADCEWVLWLIEALEERPF